MIIKGDGCGFAARALVRAVGMAVESGCGMPRTDSPYPSVMVGNGTAQEWRVTRSGRSRVRTLE